MNSVQRRLSKGYDILRTDGIREFVKMSLRFVHVHLIRPYLPGKEYPELNGVTVGSEKRRYTVFDNVVPWSVPSNPDWSFSLDNYKNESISLLRKYVREGDRVVVIGGGFGVSTIAAGREAGPSGEVISYEGSEERFITLQKTATLNDVSNIVPEHAIVGSPMDISGSSGDASVVDPAELTDYDVLEMDCEGAEMSIIESLEYRPRVIVVESHPENNSSSEKVQRLLQNRGYEITDINPDPLSGDVIASVRRD